MTRVTRRRCGGADAKTLASARRAHQFVRTPDEFAADPGARPNPIHPQPQTAMRRALLPAAATLALAACGGAADARQDGAATAAAGPMPTADTTFYPSWTKHASMYEVNVRQYTPEGTFAALETHLPRLDSLGVDILWLMPVQPIGVKNRKGGLGSYYSIADYTAINPEHGTEADFKRFVDAAHARGMRVILDWVANHTAHDHPWIAEHRDWHDRRPDGTPMNARDNEGRETDWTDVAELNYGSAEMRKAMIGEMRWWVDSMGIDGFRADVAGGVPMDFWMEARTALKAVRPDLFLLAEAETPQIHAAFEMTYGWELHHLLNQIAKGEKTTAELDAYFARQDAAYGRGAYRMYFTSNHDENSWQGTEFERMGANHLPSFVLAATVQNSMPLMYTGQEVSLNKRLRFFEKDTVDWSGPSLAPFYTAMLDLKETQPALANGPWGAPQVKLQTDGGDRVYAFTRTQGANTVLVAVNFGAAPASVSYRGLAQTGTYTDWFSKETATLGADGKIEIPANGWRVLVK
jgi:glycosidase